MGMSRVTREAAEAGELKETPVLLSFSVDEVSEQLTLMDAVSKIWKARDWEDTQACCCTKELLDSVPRSRS